VCEQPEVYGSKIELADFGNRSVAEEGVKMQAQDRIFKINTLYNSTSGQLIELAIQ